MDLNTINTVISEEELLRRAIEGEADWINGAEFDDFSIEEAEIEDAVTAY